MDVSGKTTILNKYGFHARPSTSFATMAKAFAASVTVTVDGIEVDGKSIMGLMSLGASEGTEILIRASGDDAQAALDALRGHVEDRFGGIE